MSSVVISGDTSGAITLQAPAVSGNTTLTLPTTSGTVVVANGAQTIEFADGSASAPSITNSGDTNTGMFFPAADTIAFAEGGVEAMRLDASGNVGIGTGNPLGKLDLGATTGQKLLTYGFSNTRYGLGVEGNEWRAFATSGAFLSFGHMSSSDGVTFTERMRIDSSGNVLVGTTTSSGKLTAYTANADATDIMYLQRVNSGTFRVRSPSGGLVLAGSPFADAVGFETNNTERMRITDAGEVWIAGTTDRGAFNLQCNGTGVWGAGAYTNGSDARIKDDITPLDSGLDVVEKLNPVTYKYKEDWSKDQSIQTGFIAQDLLIALEGKEYVDGIVNQSSEYMSVAYQNIIPILTKAIQELKAIVDEQAEKIKALEAK